MSPAPVPTQNSKCGRNSRSSLAFEVLSRDRTGIESVGLGLLAQRGSDHGLDAFYEVSPRVDRPSLIETDRFIGSVNHRVGRLRELRDDGIGHAGIGETSAHATPDATARCR